MYQVKTFAAFFSHHEELDKDVNEFCEEHDVIEIQFRTMATQTDKYLTYSVIYKEHK